MKHYKKLSALLYDDIDTALICLKLGKPVKFTIRVEIDAIHDLHYWMPATQQQFKQTAERVIALQEKKAAIRTELNHVRRQWHSVRRSPVPDSTVRERYAELVRALLKLHVSLRRAIKRNHAHFNTLMWKHSLLLRLQHDVDFLSDEGDC